MHQTKLTFEIQDTVIEVTQYPHDIPHATIWMRSVYRYLKKTNISFATRKNLFKKQFGRSKESMIQF